MSESREYGEVISPEHFAALVKIMRENQVVDLASGNTRIVLSAQATLALPGAPVDPMRPIAPGPTVLSSPTDAAREEEELLFASSGGPPPEAP